jgi:octaprenyl-diphosphate synthase
MLRTAPPKLEDIQAPVSDRLDAVMEEIRRIVVADFGPMEEVGDYLLQVRGKLFRPTLLLLANEVTGRPGREAETIAAVLEMVHLATLVHDDAVDHSVLRRGMPTVNALWSHQVAIIMGDYLYSRSVTEIARLRKIEPIEILSRAATAMTVGEMRQLTSYDALDFGEDDYVHLIECKTASLISAACELGALSGGPELRERMSRFGRDLGMAFQIVDDLLDYTSDESVTGKPSGLDLREHKVTLPLIAVLPSLTPTSARWWMPSSPIRSPTTSGSRRSSSWSARTAAWIMPRSGRRPTPPVPARRSRGFPAARRWMRCGRASPTWSSAGADGQARQSNGYKRGGVI